MCERFLSGNGWDAENVGGGKGVIVKLQKKGLLYLKRPSCVSHYNFKCSLRCIYAHRSKWTVVLDSVH